ncbi:MAG: hypothetical protein K0T99_03075 [Alphaproteobacteria bacterium]|nr:hypothetical protein [Alphaproteobacteria bacterium]
MPTLERDPNAAQFISNITHILNTTDNSTSEESGHTNADIDEYIIFGGVVVLFVVTFTVYVGCGECKHYEYNSL